MDKIEALKLTLDKLNDPNTDYRWDDQRSCNAGLLAQSVMNTDREGIGTLLYKSEVGASWGGSFHPYGVDTCSITGFPLNEIFDTLTKTGFTKNEIDNLEQLNDKIICKKANIKILAENDQKVIKDNVIKYITAWIEIIEEAPKVEETEERIVYVTLDKEVKELTKQTIQLN